MAGEQYSSCFSLSDITDSLHLIPVLETEPQWCSVGSTGGCNENTFLQIRVISVWFCSYWRFLLEMETRHMTSGFPSLLFSQSPRRRLRVYRPHLVFLHCSFSKLCCPGFSLLLWFMANESGMREYVRGGMGTFGEMAVSGQTTSRQVGKWSEVFVRVCVLLLFFHYRGICRSVCYCRRKPLIVFKWKTSWSWWRV